MQVRCRSRAFTLIELVVVIVVIALLLGLAAFGYTKFIAGSRETAARSVAVQVAKAIQGHSANHQMPYGEPVYGDGTDGTVLGSHPAPDVVAGDLPAGAVVTGMVDTTDPDTSEQASTVAVGLDGHWFTVVFATGQTGTPGQVTNNSAGTPGGLAAPTNLTAHQPLGSAVDLTWTHPGADSYTVYLDAAPAWTGTTRSAALDALPSGSHTVTVTATRSGTESAPSAPVQIRIAASNDAYTDRWTAGNPSPGSSWESGTVTNAAATKETGEAGTYTLRTLWWTFTAPADATYTFSALPGESGTPIANARITIYNDAATVDQATAAELGAIDGGRSVALFLTADQTVTVQVGSRWSPGGGETTAGTFRLRVLRGPANDAYASPAPVPPVAADSTWTSAPADNTHASQQPGELGTYLRRTLWWTFTPPQDGTYTFSAVPGTTGTPIARARITVWSAAGSVEAVTEELGTGTHDTGGVALFLAAGQAVVLQAGSSWSPGGGETAAGTFQLTVSSSVANDAFSGRVPVPSTDPDTWESSTVNNAATSKEPGEAGIYVSRTVWWTFTAPADGTYSFQALPGQTGTPIANARVTVYNDAATVAGTTATELGSNNAGREVKLPLTEGQVVAVQVGSSWSPGGGETAAGTFRLRVTR